MKFSKLGVMFAAATIAAGAFADAANLLVSFSTEGDKYADGTTVKDGEWYALCWAADGSFEGLNLDCTPVDPNDRVLILAPLAQGGRCPYVIFEVEASDFGDGSTEMKDYGKYFVYLLDTRNVDQSSVAGEKVVAGRCEPAGTVNGSAQANKFTATASLGVKSATGSAVASNTWSAVNPKITGFELVGNATVKITVAGMMKGLTYKVSSGADLESMVTTDITPTTEDGKASFYVSDKNARFFQIVTQE